MPMGKERGANFEALPIDEQGRPWQERKEGQKFVSIMRSSEFAVEDKQVADLKALIRRQAAFIDKLRTREAARREQDRREIRRLEHEVAILQRRLVNFRSGRGT